MHTMDHVGPDSTGRSMPIIAMVVLAALATLGFVFMWPG